MVKTCVVKGCKNRWLLGSRIKFHMFPKNPEFLKKWVWAIRQLDVNFTPTNHSFVCSDHFEPTDYHDNNYERSCLFREAVPIVIKSSQCLENLKCDSINFIDMNKFGYYDVEEKPKIDENLFNMSNNVENKPIINQTLENLSDEFVKEEPQPYENLSDSRNNESSNSITDGAPANTNEVGDAPSTVGSQTSSSNNPRKRKRTFLGDFCKEDMENSSKAQRFYDIATNTLNFYKKELKALHRIKRNLEYRLNKFPAPSTPIKSPEESE